MADILETPASSTLFTSDVVAKEVASSLKSVPRIFNRMMKMSAEPFSPQSELTVGTQFHYPINYYWSNSEPEKQNKINYSRSRRLEERFDVDVKTYKRSIGPFSKLSDLFLINTKADSFKALTILPAADSLIQSINMDFFGRVCKQSEVNTFNAEQYYSTISYNSFFEKDINYQQIGDKGKLAKRKNLTSESEPSDYRFTSIYLQYSNQFYDAIAKLVYSNALMASKMALGSNELTCITDSTGQGLLSSVSFINSFCNVDGSIFNPLQVLPLSWKSPFEKRSDLYCDTFLTNADQGVGESKKIAGPYGLLNGVAVFENGCITKIKLEPNKKSVAYLRTMLGLEDGATCDLQFYIGENFSFATKGLELINRQQSGNHLFNEGQAKSAFTLQYVTDDYGNKVDFMPLLSPICGQYYAYVTPVRVWDQIKPELTDFDNRIPVLNVEDERGLYGTIISDCANVWPFDCLLLQKQLTFSNFDLPTIIGKPGFFFCPTQVPYTAPKLTEFHGAENFFHDTEELNYLLPKWSNIYSSELLIDMYSAIGIGFNSKMFSKFSIPQIL